MFTLHTSNGKIKAGFREFNNLQAAGRAFSSTSHKSSQIVVLSDTEDTILVYSVPKNLKTSPVAAKLHAKTLTIDSIWG
jgi:hypothetical protein